ncbi:WG repeat-containing protein [Caldicellulosiruptor naganoensis]|uniref:WG repeat-containing protein n=1 Tax=Caldicellulosiruptor naganoensis TaxID=29324 RepID=A0ABY7BGB5_9FIRM|nr:WG repeat-containing protein [Caldicellulosiruptor naganoensis]WAM31619.1 WG repeat-containing protein [Caldicellulosiruptor naganoensis]
MFKKRFIAFVSVFLSLILLFSQVSAQSLLKNKYIYIFPTYENIHFFSNGLIAFCYQKKWGFMDSTGKVLLNAQFDDIDVVVYDGRNIMGEVDKIYNNIFVVKKDGKIGFVDGNCNFLVKPSLDSIEKVYPYLDILTVKSDGKIGFLNLAKNKLTLPQFDKLLTIASQEMYNLIMKSINTLKVQDFWHITPIEYLLFEKKGKWGLLDFDGNEVIEAKYDKFEDVFADGIFKKIILEKLSKGSARKLTQPALEEYIDIFSSQEFKDGKVVAEKYKLVFHKKDGRSIDGSNTYDGAKILLRGKFAAVKKNGKWGVIDTNGKWVVNPKYEDIRDFSEGFAAVKLSGKWGFIDKNFKEVIKPQFDSVFDFKEGLAAVKLKGKWGFVDTTSKLKIKPQFDEVKNFSEGFAAVKMGKYWTYINKNGTPFKTSFNSADDFFAGIGKVEVGGKIGFVSTDGQYILSPRFKKNADIIWDNINYVYRMDTTINSLYKYIANYPKIGYVIVNSGKIGLLMKVK